MRSTVQQIYEAMQRIAPLELAESWDNPGLLVDCGGEVRRVLVALDITPEVVAEAAEKHCEAIVSHHPVIFDPLRKLCPQDVPFRLVQAGISAVCMHTNLDAAEGGVNEVLAGIFRMQDMEVFAEGCGRVGSVEEITVPELARKAQQELAASLAKQTGFSEEDFTLFIDALKGMFDCDRSAARGLMSAQKLILFRHDSVLGNAPANKLFDLVKVERTTNNVPRSFSDYQVTIDKTQLPAGVSVEEVI